MTEKIKFSDGTQQTREEIRESVKEHNLTLDDLETAVQLGLGIEKGSEGYKVYKEEIEKYQAEKKQKSKLKKPSKRKLRRPLHPRR